MKKVLIAILARDKEATLPLYLECIKNLDYPKEDIILYIRTNNNSDNTEAILENFMYENNEYFKVIYNDNEEDQFLYDFKHHDWNPLRFKILGDIRQESMNMALRYVCDFYFVVDCDNFILPHTLKNLITLNLPIVAPMLNNDTNDYYSNYHYDIDENGYFKDHPTYYDVFNRKLYGTIKYQ